MPSAETQPALEPASARQRVGSVDVLRGFATLGIFPMNVLTGFGLVMAIFYNPPAAGGFEGVNYLLWLGTHALFDMKMMTIFSALFGAGLILMDQRSSNLGRTGFGTYYYRRIGVLALIGLLHGYLFWFGDILFMYALCGAALYPARKLSATALLAIGSGLVLIGAIVSAFFGLFFSTAAFAGLEEPTFYTDFAGEMLSNQAAIAEEVAQRSGSLGSLLVWNALNTLEMHLFVIPFFMVWRVLGVMLIGAAAMKLGIFSAERSATLYARMAATGYAVGLPIVVLSGLAGERSGFEPAMMFGVTMTGNYIGSLFVAAGHVGIVMLACRRALLPLVQRTLAAVGRMALTNYLVQTVLGLLTFSAWGFGLINQWDRLQLWLFVLAVWLLQALYSTLWLRRYRFGPAEWLWRSLTYGQLQSARQSHPASTA